MKNVLAIRKKMGQQEIQQTLSYMVYIVKILTNKSAFFAVIKSSFKKDLYSESFI
jgi:hypothetical protein